MNGDDMDQSLRPTRLMLYVVGALVILRVISLIIVKRFYTSAPIITTQTISIVVLGDIGRSPRIQYHALSFAEAGFLVDLIGYAGSQPSLKILGSSRIRIMHLVQPPSFLSKLPRLVFPFVALIKVVVLTISLLYTLLVTARPQQYILVQNPPSIPTLMIAHISCCITRAKLIIDWHNFGFTVLGAKLGSKHPLVWASRLYENFFGRWAYAHLTVTNAMREELRAKWHVQGKMSTLYDRPPETFHRLSLPETHEFLSRFNLEKQVRESIDSKDWMPVEMPDSTLLTVRKTDGTLAFRERRPKIVVSSTSWTLDEDFGPLLEAILQIDGKLQSTAVENIEILFLITGKGPLRSDFITRVSRLKLVHCKVVTLWLTAEDYPRLLGIADLGISLHKSTSDMDLPMKIVDMFGCGLPVVALRYPCLRELVKEGETGVMFDNAAQLGDHIMHLLSPSGSRELENMRAALRELKASTWKANWLSIMGRVLGS